MSVKAREEKNKERKGKILFISRTRVIYFRLYGSGQVGLSGFQKSQPVLDLQYPFIMFFDLLFYIISTLFDFDELNCVR